jgi:2Fe-2S ferredoxin
MVKIVYVEHHGARHVVEVAVGLSVMEGATRNNIRGIDAECGGACSCATCHVYVDEAWLAAVGESDDTERQMLDFAENVEASSRLSCQLVVSGGLDGLTVTMPESQG